MDATDKKKLREQYENRHPDMGIICWQSGDNMWVDISTDANADFNGQSFQLKLGSWPNREMQAAYKKDPESFKWSLIETLDYKDLTEDHTDDLLIMLMDFMEQHPEAKPLRPQKRIK